MLRGSCSTTKRPILVARDFFNFFLFLTFTYRLPNYFSCRTLQQLRSLTQAAEEEDDAEPNVNFLDREKCSALPGEL
jgi:hypothetical protein